MTALGSRNCELLGSSRTVLDSSPSGPSLKVTTRVVSVLGRSSKTKTLSPIAIWSPGLRTASEISAPFSFVPFVLLRSRM